MEMKMDSLQDGTTNTSFEKDYEKLKASLDACRKFWEPESSEPKQLSTKELLLPTQNDTSAKEKSKKKRCSFCLRNKMARRIYGNHNLKDKNGTLECDYLRNSVCSICGATGQQAHTKKYCPANTYQNPV